MIGCALTELSIVRVSMADKTIAASFTDAGKVLTSFIDDIGSRYRFVDSLSPSAVLRGRPEQSHKDVSDQYLRQLAVAHRARLATLDAGIEHTAVFLIG